MSMAFHACCCQKVQAQVHHSRSRQHKKLPMAILLLCSLAADNYIRQAFLSVVCTLCRRSLTAEERKKQLKREEVAMPLVHFNLDN